MAVVSIRGPKGSGKSSFSATWRPGEARNWFDIEAGAIRIHQPPEILVLWKPSDEEGGGQALLDTLSNVRLGRVFGYDVLWNLVHRQYLKVIQEPAPIIVFDTWKMVWTYNTMAHLSSLQIGKSDKDMRKSLMPRDYGSPNSRMDGIIMAAHAFSKDLILISHERPVYITGLDENGNVKEMPHPTLTEPDSYKHTPGFADWEFRSLYHKIKPEEKCPVCSEDKQKNCPRYHFSIEIEKSPVGAHLVGTIFYDVDYEQLMTAIKLMNGGSTHG